MKFPRMNHLSWSEGMTSDDLKLTNETYLKNKQLVYTEKLDGENTCMTRDNIHARSENSLCNSPWQTYVKNLWGNIKQEIPKDMFIFGENMFAVHSITYEKLEQYFYVFAIVQDNRFLSFEDTIKWTHKLSFHSVPFITIDQIKQFPIPNESLFGSTCEGYVVRNIKDFHVNTFEFNVAKCVRKNHVQTDKHWTKTWTKHILSKIKDKNITSEEIERIEKAMEFIDFTK